MDHDFLSFLVLAQRFELDFHLHPDAELGLLPREHGLHARAFGQVDLAHAVAPGVIGALAAEEREVDVRPGVERAARRELDVLGVRLEAARAHEAAREEVLVARATARANGVI